MFRWKRQRKEAPEACSLPSVDDPSSSDCSEPATPTAAGPGPSSLCPPSIELAALDSSPGSAATAAAAAAAVGRPALVPEQASVRTKAAFFEALIHTNTTAHVVCTAEGTQQHSYPAASASCDAPAALAACSSTSSGYEGGGEGGGGYSEVHIQLRLPHPAPPRPAGGRYGGVAEMEALIEALQAQLAVSERQRQAALDAYARREGECANLRAVVREISQSRAKTGCQAASLAERYAELQQEYHRMLRITDACRTVSKENLAQTSRTRSELRRVQSELHATRRDARDLSESAHKARVENALLREKVQLLERLDLEEALESEVKKHHTRYRLLETY